ncbi:heme-binding domain-containing protein [Adhaeribacter radiodurans]|uniref:Heme-binding domain-containing protein n=1 Tax=Adhaeribacter radiodurans TaxID=2745197 RepID=A0A7L7LC18_9BACT|nr:heme-binding domain-containing protein [Adhaeribacter radiodurans]QMU30388.1 heme-binding domain-containing protein [Adhaeribacter radiodurans]
MNKKVLFLIILVLILIQFFRPTKNISRQEQPQALKKRYIIPANVEVTLQKACYDCHSNNTRYPWYAEIQPIAWFLADHVKEGKEELNFDEFLTYPTRKQDHKLEEIVETQEEGTMPLSSYTFIHKEANLNPRQKNEIITWVNTLRQQIQSNKNN